MLIVEPKFNVSDTVYHKSDQNQKMVIKELIFKHIERNTAFGARIKATSKNSFFTGEYRCEWIFEGERKVDTFHQDQLTDLNE